MWLDRSLGWGLMPLYGLYHGYRCVKGRESPQNWSERWGYTKKHPYPSTSLVWMHAASLGESCTALGLFDLLKHMSSVPLQLLLTTGTETSRTLCMRRQDSDIIHQRMPWDVYSIWKKFFRHWQPRVGMIIESELWPFCLRHPETFPLFWMDGRLSDTGVRRWHRAKGVLSGMMQRFSQVTVSHDQYRTRIKKFYGGNVAKMPSGKWLVRPPQGDKEQLKQWKNALGDRPVWCVANVHPPEEAVLHRLYERVLHHCPKALLVVIPRYPHKPLRLPGRGQWSTSVDIVPREKTDVYGIQAFNVLGLFYAISTVAWIGGSFFSKGGHNPLEAAHHGCWPVAGPYIFNNPDTWQRLHRLYPSIYTNVEDLAGAIVTLLRETDQDRTHRQTLFHSLHHTLETTWKHWMQSTILPYVS